MTGDILLGVISDTHIARPGEHLPAGILESLRGAELILHAGDLTHPSVLDLLATVAPVEAVAGNMDPPELKRRLPFKRTLELGGFRIGLIHGWGPPGGIRERVANEFERVDVIVYGHSHIAHQGWERGVFFLNPGTTSGMPLKQRPSVGLISLGEIITGRIVHLSAAPG